jgi:molybdenum cofactor guanylyltransferase
MLRKTDTMFHPFEIAVCGLSGSGKTTLLTGVLRHFRQSGYEPGYFKHGCHRFNLDREGKDSFRAGQAGAVSVMIADPEKEALVSSGSGSITQSSATLACDILFIEGLKELPTAKLLLVDAGGVILPLLDEGVVRNVIALVHEDHPTGLERFGLPVFHRDEVDGIASFIEGHLAELAAKVPVYGLVLAGGRSSRMGADKALLNYNHESQLAATASLLSGVCGQVFVSCRQEQVDGYDRFGWPVITDAYLDMGPMGGLLSAQRSHPDAAWFIAACDFPLMDERYPAELAAGRNPFMFATAFRRHGSERPEPLFTIYEPKSRLPLLRQHGTGNDSLSSFLTHSRIAAIEPADPTGMRNINDRDAMELALKAMRRDERPC